jgi:hypothetical protein
VATLPIENLGCTILKCEMCMSVLDQLKKIQNKLDQVGHAFYYVKTKSGYTQFHRSKTVGKVQQKEINRVIGKIKRLPKYIFKAFVSINPKYINNTPDDSSPIHGPLFVGATVYRVNQKKKTINLSIADKSRNQAIWYTKKELQKKKFMFKDMSSIIDAVYKEKICLLPFGNITISEIRQLSSRSSEKVLNPKA